MTAELKPCPFCGGEAHKIPDPNHSTDWDVGCFNGSCPIEPHVWAVHMETAETQWNTRTDLSRDLEQARQDIADLRQAVQYANDHADQAKSERDAAIAAAMMGAVKPLEWVRGIVDYAKPLAGVKYVACSRTPAGQWTWWLDGESEIRNVFQSEAEAKAAAEADWQARNAALRVIPADALAALEAALMQAYKEGWSDGAANYHHDRNETPHEGWLISDTYLDTAAMSQEK